MVTLFLQIHHIEGYAAPAILFLKYSFYLRMQHPDIDLSAGR